MVCALSLCTAENGRSGGLWLCAQERKDKEKLKRQKGQSAIGSWKTEVRCHGVVFGLGCWLVNPRFVLRCRACAQAEMVLRQQFDS